MPVPKPQGLQVNPESPPGGSQSGGGGGLHSTGPPEYVNVSASAVGVSDPDHVSPASK